MISKIQRNPEEMERNYHAVTNKDFLTFSGQEKTHVQLLWEVNFAIGKSEIKHT